ncbi:MAG: threonine synthase [Thaumarchaeota archaeon]|nr:threonine synthase [Nitrososphaerota archaeon]
MGKVQLLQCRECGKEYEPTFRYICEECFGPLEVKYDIASIKVTGETFASRPKSLWRYFELLPLDEKSRIIDLGAGYTPLHKAERLAKRLGLRNLYIKNDTVNPTFSFKDRPASVAVSKALELGLSAVGSPSTGNLAAATAAHAARAGLPCYIFIPWDIEPTKVVQAAAYGAEIVAIKGTYDDANKLATQAGEIYNIGVVNVNLRPYYVEGSKTLGFEVCEQLGWKAPDHVIVPTGSGALLCALGRGFDQLKSVGLIRENNVKITSAQPYGCSPIVDAIKKSTDVIDPVERPNTIAKSLAIGEPGDGIYAARTVMETKGFGENCTDEEIVDAIKLLASTEGIFTEPAGGVTIAVLRKLIGEGKIDAGETVVCYVTGNGLKTPEAVSAPTTKPIAIDPKIEVLAQIIRR